MQIRNLLNINVLAILFFILIFLLGIKLYQDYGISLDETFHRDNASFWYIYSKGFILELWSLILNNSESFIPQNIKNEVDLIGTVFYKEGGVPSLQPVPLAIFYEFFVDIFNIESTKNIFQYRHLYNFVIYLIGLYFFYKLIYKRYKSYFYSLIGLLLLFLTPRFFAESFYNPQDIFFLSMTIINMYTGVNFLEKTNIKNTLAFSLTSALAIDTRIFGVISVLVVLFFFFMKSFQSNKFLKNNLKFVLYYIFFTFLLIILFWPFLWADPIKNLLLAFSQLSSAAYPITSFYLEKFTLSTTIPWHYHIVWIGVTTPLIVILLFLVGFLFLIRRIFFRFIKLDENSNDIWRGNNEMFDIYFLMMILFPILLAIKQSLGYSGWRHLYFIYPSIIMISLYGFYYLHLIFKTKIIRVVIYLLITINLTYLVHWNYKFHPYQYVYFNPIFKNDFHEKFEMDYWGLSNKSAIEYIIANNSYYPIKIATKSFASLQKSSLILNDNDKTKISITGDLDEADYIITNYAIRLNNDYIIDKNKYKKYYEVLVDNKPINTVYKKIK